MRQEEIDDIKYGNHERPAQENPPIAQNEYLVSEFLPKWFGWKYRMSTPTSRVAIIEIDSIEMLDEAIRILDRTPGNRLGSLYDHVGYCRKEFMERNNGTLATTREA